MPTSRLRLIVAALIVPALLIATACGSGDETDEKDWRGQSITLGSVFSTTGPGAAYGPQQVRGAELAVKMINEQEDGVHGADLAFEQRDDRSLPERSAKVMRNLIEDGGVTAVLGPTFSNSAAEADPVANDLATPVLAVSNTGPGIVGDCPYECDFVFRDSLGEESAIPANIDVLMGQRPWNAMTILYPRGDAFGESSAMIAKEAFEGRVTEDGPVTARLIEVSSDGSVPMARVFREENVDPVFIAASAGDVAARMIRQINRNTRRANPILGGNAFNSQAVSKEAGEAGKGAQSAAAWYAGNPSEENREFIAAYRTEYGEDPDQFAAQSYTGVVLLAAALADADLTFDDLATDRELVKESLERVQIETPLGSFRFTDDHDVSQPIWVVRMDGKGDFDLVEEVAPE